MNEEKILLSISAYIELLNEQLKLYKASIIGEVVQVKVWSSGHVYFTLKDKETGAILDCVVWKRLYSLYGIKLETGMELIASGQANIYPTSGRLSFIVDSIEIVGEGALKKAYDRLKKRLFDEGLFAEERKRTLPVFPRRIGIITSKQGAVIHDFMNNLNKHGFQITLIDTRVEGQEALPDLYNALRTMKQRDVEVIVLMRGGGSLQSLAAFDAESLIREIAFSPIPIIAAIGHHQDIPLCALAADVMVSTPTAAANLLNMSWEKGRQAVTRDYQRIVFSYKQILNDSNVTIQLRQAAMIDKFQRVLHIFSYATAQMPKYLSQLARVLKIFSERITNSSQHIMISMRDSLVTQSSQIDSIERLIHVYDPMRQLLLGYSLIRGEEGRLVKSIKDVKIGERLEISVRDGMISSQVGYVKEKQK